MPLKPDWYCERENRYTLKWFHNFWILFSHFNSENSSIRLTYFNKMLQIIVCLDFARQNMIVMISKYNKVETKLLLDQGSMAFTLSTTAWTITANNKETYNVMLTRKATSPSHLFPAIPTKLMEIWTIWKNPFHVFLLTLVMFLPIWLPSVGICLKNVNNWNIKVISGIC